MRAGTARCLAEAVAAEEEWGWPWSDAGVAPPPVSRPPLPARDAALLLTMVSRGGRPLDAGLGGAGLSGAARRAGVPRCGAAAVPLLPAGRRGGSKSELAGAWRVADALKQQLLLPPPIDARLAAGPGGRGGRARAGAQR